MAIWLQAVKVLAKSLVCHSLQGYEVGSAVKMDGQGARHSEIDFEIQKRAMLCYSILALVSTSSYTSAPGMAQAFHNIRWQ